ncbi:unnamed protein product, partial [Discosporangium mesarthrocarpum]
QLLLEVDYGGEYMSAKSCKACAVGTFVFEEATTEAGVDYAADLMTCQSCPDENMSFDNSGTCSCNSGYSMTGVASLGPLSCVDSSHVNEVASWNNIDAFMVTFRSVRMKPESDPTGTKTLSSMSIEHLYLRSAALCYSYTGSGGDGLQACQALGNICVLHEYNLDSEPCDLIAAILDNRASTSYGQDGWGATLPWLYYLEDSVIVRDSLGLEMEFTFSSQVTLVLAKYSLNGTWLGLEEMTTQPYYCTMSAPRTSEGGGSSRSTKYLQFGHSMSEQFLCDLSSLLGEETYFYDPYIVDESTGYLYPVAVLNTNYRENNAYPNVNTQPTDELNDQFTRRFFFFDSVSGITDESKTVSSFSSSSSASSNPEENGNTALVPEVLRYVSDMRVTFKIRTDNPEMIYTPVLELAYEEVMPELWETYPSLQTPTVTLTVEYTMDTTDFWDLTRAFFAVAMVLIGLTAMWRLRNWNVRTSRVEAPVATVAPYSTVNWPLVIQTSMITMHTFVLYLFPFTFLVTAYWFVFFKLQDSVFLMLPADRVGYGSKGEYYPLEVMVLMIFLFQGARVIYLLYCQCTADVFLVDWEKVRFGAWGSVTKEEGQRSEGRGGEPHSGGSDRANGVSVWRQLLVANEWNKLGTQRRVSLSFTLLWMGFFLSGKGLQQNATPQPALSDREEGTLNPALRFANVSFWWFLLSASQWLFRWGIYEQYITEPPELRFLDMATMAKISILILDEKYHGWYLHCRSPYPKADVPMEAMSEQLDKEEAGLTTDRGLEGCAKDLQSFEIFVTTAFRRKYDKIYRSILPPSGFDIQARMAAKNQQAEGLLGGPNRTQGPNVGERGRSAAVGALRGLRSLGGPQPRTSEIVISAARELTSFLQGFVEQSYSREELKRSYREPAWWDRLVGTPPDMRQASGTMANTPCILYPDNKSWFTSATLLGYEFDLIIFNAATYHAFDLWFGDPTTSILLTFLLDRLVVGARAYFGRANVSRKTLVDARFLL